MKRLIAVSVIILTVLFVPAAKTLEPGPARIRLISISTIDTRRLPGVTIRVFSLWNRPQYKNKLGMGFEDCYKITKEFIDCYLTLRLSRGQITSRGIVSVYATIREMAVVGGTGYYNNVGGDLVIQPIGRDTFLILVDLIAF